MEHRPVHLPGPRMLGRRGLTVLSLIVRSRLSVEHPSLVLISLAVIVVAVLLTRTLAR